MAYNCLDDWEAIKIKADLLCLGIRSNEVAETIYHQQNPQDDFKTGNVGLHISMENGSHVLVTASHSFDNRSPYSIGYRGKQLVLSKGQVVVDQIKEVPMPKWYSMKTTKSVPMPKIFLHEGSSFLHQTYSGCDYHSKGLGCKFCGTGPELKNREPREIGETVAEAAKENPKYHVCLGGGTRLPPKRNIEYFSECITEIRKNDSKIPIWIEMVPPESDRDILQLTELGATSFGFNIEIWDDSLRNKICPGKSIIPKIRYLKAMEKALDVLGPNRVGSCLVAGLEPIENTINGATELASIGVQPCIIPFKPYDNSEYDSLNPCSQGDLIKASKSAVNAMIEYSVNPEENQGCLHCESCTVDHDIYRLIEKN